MNIILLGAPGSGKGTVSEKVKEKLNLVHISTGDIFRKAIKDKTELGKQVIEFTESGNLVPDELTISLIKERLSQKDVQNGYLLDGFPRTLSQAKALDEIASIDHVIFFNLEKEQLIKRLSGRRLCPSCGSSFHTIFIPPSKENICDNCNHELIQRKDDMPEAIQIRLNKYEIDTSPLIQFYKEKGLLRDLNANNTPVNVVNDFINLIK